MKKNHYSLPPPVLLIWSLLFACAILPAGALADNYIGGIPLDTTTSGTVSGGLWFDSYYGMSGTSPVRRASSHNSLAS